MYLIRCLKDWNLIFSIDFCLYFFPDLCLVMKQSSKRDIIIVGLNRQNPWIVLPVLSFNVLNGIKRHCVHFRFVILKCVYCIC